MSTLPAREIGNPRPEHRDRLVIVDDPELGSVAVRFLMTYVRWRCKGCGTRTHLPECAHTFAAALLLAESILGLTTEGTQT